MNILGSFLFVINSEMLEFKQINKQFSEQYLLQDFSFTVAEGDKVNISGKSGIGKSTLFKMVLGFEKPTAGEILYKGKKLDDALVWELRKEVAYVSQDLNIGQGNVREFFAATMSLKANAKQNVGIEAKLKDLLAFFELPEVILDKNVEELSGGEKQRVAIINALLLNRKFFLLDEISSALDKDLKEKVINFFLKKEEFTVLYISHDNYLPEGVNLKSIQL